MKESNMMLALKDLIESFERYPFILRMAFSDTKARYKRSILGPFWLTLGSGLGVVGLGVVWSVVLKQSRSELMPSLAVGLLFWQFISGCINESSSVFIRHSSIIRNIKTPFFIFPLQLLMRHLITFMHNMIVIFFVFLVYPPNLSVMSLMCLVGFFLVVMNLLWIITLFGIIGTRYRDLEPIINSFMPIMFFMTPVIFKLKSFGFMDSIIWFNPFTYFMTAVRDPLIGQMPSLFVYEVLVGMVIIGWLFTIMLFNSRINRLAFWI